MLFLNVALIALYAAFVVSFCVLLFVQFRMTLMLWRFMYATFGVRIWHVFRADSAYRQQFEAFRQSAPFTALKHKWRRAGIWVLGSFMLLFCLVALISLLLPALTDRIWLLR